MEIFQQEIEDGLSQAIASQSSIAYISPAVDARKSLHLNEKSIAEFLFRSNASSEDQADLFYLTSVLVSTGWNKNDDIFLAEEMWAARHTPEDKQFNYMHNEKDIIGHITGNYAVNFEGELIEDDIDFSMVPPDFNIITNAVIYKSWSDKDLRDRMKTIVAEIEAGGKWHVSMECLFPRFDYALQDAKGSIRLVNREESTAYLTKHLRAYGGTGEYDGYKLGRVLRNLSFSGKGLVTKPANPRSIIINEKSVSDIKEKQMDIEELKAKLAKAELELAEAAKMNEEMKKKMEQKKDEESKATLAQLEEYKTAIAEKDQTLASLQEQVNQLSQQLTETRASLEAIQAEKEATEAKWHDMQKKMKMEKRKAQLAEAGVDEPDLDETLASIEALDDASFDKIVAMMKKKMAKKMMKPEDDAKASASVADEILEDVVETEKTVASVVNETVNDDEVANKLRSSAAEWLGGCFSTLGKKTKK